MTLPGFPQRLRTARVAAGLTQSAVAGVIGCSVDTVSNYERGRTEPRLVDIARLATIYRVSCDWILTGSPRLKHRFEGVA